MLGLLGLLGVPFNAANLLFLPLIAGWGPQRDPRGARFREIEKRVGVPAGCLLIRFAPSAWSP